MLNFRRTVFCPKLAKWFMDSLGMRQNEYTPELWDTLVIRLTLGSYRFDVSSRAGRCEVDEFADEIVAAM